MKIKYHYFTDYNTGQRYSVKLTSAGIYGEYVKYSTYINQPRRTLIFKGNDFHPTPFTDPLSRKAARHCLELAISIHCENLGIHNDTCFTLKGD